MPKQRRNYTSEFKDEAVKMVIKSVSCEAVMGLPVERLLLRRRITGSGQAGG
jgi:hypothetical protein